MREIEINILTKLPEEVVEKKLDQIDQVIATLLETEDIIMFSKEYSEE